MFKKGHKAWNKGLDKTDTRVLKYSISMRNSIIKGFKNGRKIWNTGLSKETNSSMKRISIKNSLNTKEQIIRTGKEKWMSDRKNFNRKGEKNNDRQKNAARDAIMKNIENGKIKSKFYNTGIEIKIKKVLTELSIQFEFQKRISNISVVDFYIPSKNMIIFCDGDYWHNLPGLKERDKKINFLLTEKGFTILRFWEHEINKNIDQVRARILKMMI
jgi:DNA mismatch endonuclease (patch repair protein)